MKLISENKYKHIWSEKKNRLKLDLYILHLKNRKSIQKGAKLNKSPVKHKIFVLNYQKLDDHQLTYNFYFKT